MKDLQRNRKNILLKARQGAYIISKIGEFEKKIIEQGMEDEDFEEYAKLLKKLIRKLQCQRLSRQTKNVEVVVVIWIHCIKELWNHLYYDQIEQIRSVL